MTKGTRALVAIGVGFIVFRISAELMVSSAAVLVGLVAGGVTWAVTRPRSRNKAERTR